jgi:hypothetical protein
VPGCSRGPRNVAIRSRGTSDRRPGLAVLEGAGRHVGCDAEESPWSAPHDPWMRRHSRGANTGHKRSPPSLTHQHPRAQAAARTGRGANSVPFSLATALTHRGRVATDEGPQASEAPRTLYDTLGILPRDETMSPDRPYTCPKRVLLVVSGLNPASGDRDLYAHIRQRSSFVPTGRCLNNQPNHDRGIRE